jgi:Predicted Zn-dependent protease (DUF2268)
MSVWSIHCPNPPGPLEPFLDDIDEAFRAAERRVSTVATPFALDIFMRSEPGAVIPERGYVGYAPSPGAVYFTFDPDNPNLPGNLGAPLERMIAHEFHHALRWYGAGYGRTLLEALVSEGLAGRFVHEIFGSDAEPWECAMPRTGLVAYAERALLEGDATQYDHAAWFYGRGNLPRWVGYTLGWELVGHYLRRNRAARPSRMAGTRAEDFLPALRALADA